MDDNQNRTGTYAVERLGALSDGVFAIVLTLLVLELKVPERDADFTNQELIADLQDQIPNFIAWIISFVLVARFWIVHHAIVATLARCHVGTMMWNFVVLGLVSLVPFGASLIGTYEYNWVAITIFDATLGLTGISLGLFAKHAAKEAHLRRTPETRDLEWHWKYHARVLPGVAALSMLLLAVHALGALAVWGVESITALVTAARRLPRH